MAREGKINSRSKGQRGERLACELLKKWTRKDFDRIPASGGLRWKKTDNIVGDVTCTTEGHYFPFSVEVKNYADINFSHLLYLPTTEIHKFWNQALSDAKRANKIPLLLMRFNRMPRETFFVVMSPSHFKELVKPYSDGKYMYIKDEFYIFNSSLLFSTNYKETRLLAKQILKDVKKSKA